MRIRIIEDNKKKISLFLPLFLVWILLLPFVIILTLFVLLAALILWPSGYGKKILAMGPAFCSVMCALAKLHIEVEEKEKKILISLI
jgi:hypothetical protein